jgi:hypothetical protein
MNKTLFTIAAATLIATSGAAYARPLLTRHQTEMFHLNGARAESSFRNSYNSFTPQGGTNSRVVGGSMAYREFHHLDTGIHD